MAKIKKQRSENYDEKLSFDGSLDDLIRKSVKHADNYKVGDIIEQEGVKVTIIATQTSEEYDIPDGFNYVVQDMETKKKYFIR